jgi:hypothetical protein
MNINHTLSANYYNPFFFFLHFSKRVLSRFLYLHKAICQLGLDLGKILKNYLIIHRGFGEQGNQEEI